MKKLSKLNALSLALAATAVLSVSASSFAGGESGGSPHCSIVGAYAANTINTNNPFTIAFNRGGTVTAHGAFDLGEPPGSPNSNYSTVTLLNWKKIDNKHYKLFGSDVSYVNALGKFFKAKFEGNISLSSDCKAISSDSIVITFHPGDDLSLSVPTNIPSVSFSFVGRRVQP